MILVYSTLIYKSKNNKLNFAKCIRNDSTAVHFLSHENKGVIFSEKGEISLKIAKKKDKKSKNAQEENSHPCKYWMYERPKMRKMCKIHV